MNIQPGDKLLHRTKYGGRNIVEVHSIIEGSCVWDLKSRTIYKEYFIKTTNDTLLKMDGSDGCLNKIERIMTDKEVEADKHLIEVLEKLKTK